ncbi:MAG: M20/M25/M40 family metallo-hydrolase, partial [Candidatus Bathyarchaeia archaeon]
MKYANHQISLENIIPLLKKLITIPSVSGNEQEISNYLIKYLSNYGFETEEIPTPKSGPSILAHHYFKAEGLNLLFYGHLDTVAPVKGWKHHPFKPTLTKNFLYGLGACDMKGGISALIAASIKLAQMKLCGSLTLAFSSDEELYSRGCDRLIRLGKLEKIDGAIVAEPTGLSTLEIGRQGRLVYDVTVESRAAHALSKVDSNAIVDSSKIILNINKLPVKKRHITVLAVNSETDFLSIPDMCRLLIHRQLKMGETKKQALTQMEKLIEKLNLKSDVQIKIFKRPTPDMKPYMVDKKSKIVKAVETACLNVTGRKPRKTIGICVGDENYLVNRAKIPTVTLGPEGGNEHSPDAYVNL